MTVNHPWCSATTDRGILEAALKGGSSGGGEGRYTFGPQPLCAAYGKIHIKDRSLIRLERTPEQICRRCGIGP
jgi:hypothetical protein